LLPFIQHFSESDPCFQVQIPAEVTQPTLKGFRGLFPKPLLVLVDSLEVAVSFPHVSSIPIREIQAKGRAFAVCSSAAPVPKRSSILLRHPHRHDRLCLLAWSTGPDR
jgi:hypothetical protein